MSEKSPESHQGPASNGHYIQRVGLDLGAHSTRITVCGSTGQLRTYSWPTLLSYSRPEAEPLRFSCIGQKAIDRRDHMRLVYPFRENAQARTVALRDFAQHIREQAHRRGRPLPWGVVNCLGSASAEEQDVRRVVANELFDRVLFVDDLFLLTVGLGSLDEAKHSVILEVGHSSIRGVLMHGATPTDEERVEVPFGGAHVDDTFRRQIAERYPELLLTGWTLSRLKEQLAFVAPVRRRCDLRIHYRGVEKVVDFTEIVQGASSSIVRPLLKAARAILARCPSDDIEVFQRNILLVGGGAQMPGLSRRLEAELRSDGFELARVRKPAHSMSPVSEGACRWAHLLRDEQWTIPLFSFA